MSDAPSPAGRTLGRSDALGIALATGLSAASGYVVFAVSSRTLSVELNTQFVTFWSTLFACFGLLSGLSIETTRAVTSTSLDGAAGAGPAGTRPPVLRVGAVSGLVAGLVLAASAAVWAPRVFKADPIPLAGLACLAIAAYALHSVLVGSLAGRHAWRPYSWLIAADATTRMVLVLGALVLTRSVVGAAAAAVAATLTWAAFLALSPAARAAARARTDATARLVARRVLAASTATGASALLVVGFPTLLSLTTPDAEYERAAPLLLAISLTRAPLLVPLTAFQGVAVSHFVAHRDRGLAALLPTLRLVLLTGVVGAAAAWLVGPWLMAAVLGGDDYRVAGGTLATLTLAATGLAALTLTGALCQALNRHGAFVAGWVLAVVCTIGVLLLPFGITGRSIAALAVGPVVGLTLHLWFLRGHPEPAATAGPVASAVEAVDPPVRPRPRVSVCLATYQGAAHVREQLASVLPQLAADDEVVVVDDGSADGTADVVAGLADPRVRLHRHEVNRGYVRTFEEAMTRAQGDVLLLCDQDDVWAPGRVDAMVAALADAAVVATNLGTLGGPPNLRGPYGQPDWRLRERQSRQHVRNVLAVLAGNRPYYGCAMGLRREALDVLVPFPAFLDESHDLWIALYGNLAASVRHLEIRSLDRRFHDGNASSPRPRGPRAVLGSRLMLVRCVRELRRRLRSAGQPG
jgi:O-antigen/teichoic acid export membrane protein